MPTLKAIRREMLARDSSLGRTAAITGLTTTTVTATQLISASTMDTNLYTGKWAVRADASTSADRQRLITSYAGATGALTHTGTNYSDTTTTGETLEVLEYEPFLYDNAINVSLARLLQLDREILPTVTSERFYHLHELSWITSPSQIEKLAYSRNPIISRDRYFEKWNTINTSGVRQPDWWPVSGTGASVARSTAQTRGKRYSAAITASGGNVASLTQSPGLLLNGAPASAAQDLRGEVVTVVGVGWADTASQLRFRITDGVSTVNTSYHSGGSTWEELSNEITVSASATTLTVSALVEVNGTAYVQECYAVQTTALDDNHRRDDYREEELPPPWVFRPSSPLVLEVDRKSRGGQFVVYSTRAYPQFDAARIAAGTADADETDAPLVTVATMAIGRLYESLAGRNGVDERKAMMMAAEWRARGEELAGKHLLRNEQPRGGVPLPRGIGVPPAYMGRWR